jgi:hypothetical protein
VNGITPNWVDWTFFGCAAILFLHALNSWVYAKPRTRRLVHMLMISGGLTLMQVDSILSLSVIWRVAVNGTSFALFAYAIWYATTSVESEIK